MAELVVELENHPSFTSEFASNDIPLPPFDDNFYSSSSDLRFLNNGDGDLEFDFDSVVDSLPPIFLIPADATTSEISGDLTPVSDNSSDCMLPSPSVSFCNRQSPMDSTGSESTIASSSSSPKSGKLAEVVHEKRKAEEEEEEEEATKISATKRKKEFEEETKIINKYRRLDEEEDGDEKKNTRLIRNRESAQLSRQRKKHYVMDLEAKVKNLHSTITDLNRKMSYFMAENASLRHQVVPPPSGMYPMPYPLMPFPAYTVPIPRLKPRQAVAKVKKKKTKNVASISVLGLLFCLFLFGALAPLVNIISYGEYKSSYFTNRVYDHSRGRVFDVSCDRSRNGSEPLSASLFLPRNEKVVKIEGNLIIRSTLATEKAMASERKSQGKAIEEAANSETRKALISYGSDETSNDNGEMQQWFRQGVAGPMFSSGMCTELLQFDVSSTSGVTQQPKNATDTHKGKFNRRILRGSRPVSDFNLTKHPNSSSKENFRETKPNPSTAVSLLVDPGEGGDKDISGMMGRTKPVSRVFIAVLVDKVKYITYSCVLPRPEVHPLATT